MKPLIYYPSFEPESDIWLKYALLYLDEFRPIIPLERRHLIRPSYHAIMTECDLINPYSPNFNVANDASIKAMDEIDRFVKKPLRNSVLFNTAHALVKWRNRANWNYQLYSEKFTQNFIYYCEDNGFGMMVPDGLLLPEDLAFLYMTFLASSSAFESGSGITTDISKFDRFTQFTRVYERDVMNLNNYARSIIDISLPRNISEIPISSIIEFRMKNRARISHFNQSLSQVEHGLDNMISPSNFISQYLDSAAAYKSDLMALGIGMSAIPFTFLTLKTNLAQWPEYMHEFLGIASLAVGGSVALHRVFRDTATHRACRKYLVKLESFR